MIRMLLCASAFLLAAAAPAYAQRAVVRGLDKVTGHASDYTLTIVRATRIGSLEVVARTCSKNAPEETPEVRIFVDVFERPPARAGEESERRALWSGWLFASSPSLSALDHPYYDIWAIDCR
jgi:hypothetical protein